MDNLKVFFIYIFKRKFLQRVDGGILMAGQGGGAAKADVFEETTFKRKIKSFFT